MGCRSWSALRRNDTHLARGSTRASASLVGSASGSVVTEVSGASPAARDVLAHAYGVSTDYWDQSGVLCAVDPEAISGVLRALGADPTNDATIASSLLERELEDWRRTLPPVVVAVGGTYAHIGVHVAHGTAARVWLELEDGRVVEPVQSDRWVEPREVDGRLIGEATYVVPADLPLGWHTIRAVTDDGVSESVLAVTPERLHPPALDSSERM